MCHGYYCTKRSRNIIITLGILKYSLRLCQTLIRSKSGFGVPEVFTLSLHYSRTHYAQSNHPRLIYTATSNNKTIPKSPFPGKQLINQKMQTLGKCNFASRCNASPKLPKELRWGGGGHSSSTQPWNAMIPSAPQSRLYTAHPPKTKLIRGTWNFRRRRAKLCDAPCFNCRNATNSRKGPRSTTHHRYAAASLCISIWTFLSSTCMHESSVCVCVRIRYY